MTNPDTELREARAALQAVRDLHRPADEPAELIWLGDGPCPDCGSEYDCDGHDTVVCRECFQPHPEDGSLASPVPWPCPTIRAVDAVLAGTRTESEQR